jgi:flagellar hook protein FlgE
MMRSMFSGVSSLRLHQTKMDVIANNIANVNTDGFKSQRATFADAFYQNLQGASGPNPDFGRSGTNPRQIGLGLSLASIDNLMHQGIARRTDNALDVAIEGGGFFIVQDRGGANMFTRTGRIERDAHWNLHIGGNMLMGWGTIPCRNTPGGHAIDSGFLQPLSLSGDKQNMPSEPTTRINITGNLNTTNLSYDATNDEHYRIVPKTIYDSLGNAYVVNMKFVLVHDFSQAAPSPHAYWTMEMMTADIDPTTNRPPVPDASGAMPTPPAGGWPQGVVAYLEGDRNNPAYLGMCLLGTTNPQVNGFRDAMVTKVTVAFDTNGNMVGMGEVDGNGNPLRFFEADRCGDGDFSDGTWVRGRQFDFTIIPISNVMPAATFGNTGGEASSYDVAGTPPPTVLSVGTLTFNFTELGQRGQERTTIQALTWDGGGPGRLMDISVGADGSIMGRYSNGRDRLLGQIPLAFFTNPAGLERVGNSFWRTSANSGPFDGVGLTGQMIGGALEGSNVDLANEFTEMITTQRGFQAASRTITVSDEMLQELVNLRR